ncbi:hypothetical protein K3495_g5618 [Podosphaera aphanis]|nr:hypothetical protein K3495_g5618 [Podosphaera aphanis]
MLKERSIGTIQKFSHDEFSTPTTTIYSSKTALVNKSSNVSLSRAAAVAALRSQPTSSTLTKDLQTKRMLRRIDWTPLQESVNPGLGSSRIQRRMSSGSMSERSFRDFSLPKSQLATNMNPIPVLPRIPKQLSDPSTTVPSVSSLRKDDERGFEPPTPSRGLKRISDIQDVTCLDRQASRESINFSLPTGSRSTSPVAKGRIFSPSTTYLNKSCLNNENETKRFLPVAKEVTTEKKKDFAVHKNIDRKDSLNQPIRTLSEIRQTKEEQATRNSPKQRDIASSNIYELAANFTSAEKTEQKSGYQGNSIPRSPQILRECDVNRKIHNQIAKVKTQPYPFTLNEKINPRLDDGQKLSSEVANVQAMSLNSLQTDQSLAEFPSYLHTEVTQDEALASTSFKRLPEFCCNSDSMFIHSEPIYALEKAVSSSIRIGSEVNVYSPTRSTNSILSPKKTATKHSPLQCTVSPRKSALKSTETPIQKTFSPTNNVEDLSEALANKKFLSTKKLDRVSFDEKEVSSDQMTPPDSDTPETIRSILKDQPSVKLPRHTDNKIIALHLSLPSFERVRPHDIIPEPETNCPAKKKNLPFGSSLASVSLDTPCTENTKNVAKLSSTKNFNSIYETNAIEERIKFVGPNKFKPDIHDNCRSAHITPNLMQTKGAKLPESNIQSEDDNVKARVNLENLITDPSKLQIPMNTTADGNLESSARFVASDKKDWLRIPGAWESSTDIICETSSFVDLSKTESCESEARVLKQFEIKTVDSIVEESKKTEESETESIYSNAVENISDLEDSRLTSLDAAVDNFSSEPKNVNFTLTSSSLINSDTHPMQSSFLSKKLSKSNICKQNTKVESKDQEEFKKDTEEELKLKPRNILIQSEFDQIPGGSHSLLENSNTFKVDPNLNRNSKYPEKSPGSTESTGILVEASGIKKLDSLRPARKLPRLDGTRNLPQNKYTQSSSPRAQTNPKIASRRNDGILKAGFKVAHSPKEDGPEQPVPLRKKTSHGSICSFKRALSVREPVKFRNSMRRPSEARTRKAVLPSTQPTQPSLHIHVHEPCDPINRHSQGSLLSKVDTYQSLHKSSFSTPSNKLRNLRLGRLSLESYSNTSKPASRFVDSSDDEGTNLPDCRPLFTDSITKASSRRPKLWNKGDLHGFFKLEKPRVEILDDPPPNDTGPSFGKPCDTSLTVGARDTNYSPHLRSKKTTRKASRNRIREGLKNSNEQVLLMVPGKERIDRKTKSKRVRFKRYLESQRLERQPQIQVNSFRTPHESPNNDTPWPLPANMPVISHSTNEPSLITVNKSVQDSATHYTFSNEPASYMNVATEALTSVDQKKKKFTMLRRMFKITD